jgi:hypothetical protein
MMANVRFNGVIDAMKFVPCRDRHPDRGNRRRPGQAAVYLPLKRNDQLGADRSCIIFPFDIAHNGLKLAPGFQMMEFALQHRISNLSMKDKGFGIGE